MHTRPNHKKAVAQFTLLGFVIISANSSYSIEGMTDEERQVREASDAANSAALGCVARHNLDIRKDDLSPCKKEIDKANEERERFNDFFTKLSEEKRKIPYGERRKQYKDLLEKYSDFSIDELGSIHKQHCVTKWGSTGSSTECNAIAESISIKKYGKYFQKENDANK
ncbi:MAG: hypothetical protein M0R47_20340 [Methylobacter sp.]|jgi:hypothetical protein|uniref:hypothetical protein n=1 Tax=Methylobacter sp. TaxID=2051955 RepID=UPI0025E80F90|nr:hypothetical protein [Methylobacter sp.]MCK9622871.1 hypothetical protein [Methylobacter sp.]